ncbi:MAG: 2-amino-4-hydroxy-6-hydroxymethyldihydropteridine diphosphokinase [Candidatus Thiodiazotropha sp. (ex Lucinoma annulata)]|nr:2-amino-4-hydroxy-6-hydroxymethyldihydropteridine diphosphokinase [Candidatus Thiodiazotropha sp. (ex Lucinoma borealis)]MCU7886306.1 2-amino-4-hydroxy-6-hydroxymethyldihydropteridine diphosphokinase [Candidatus Thiodiazotropha sp. (ex Lucinoma annulata)]MCU7947264.1 2-amino-4-hydroxy-6-hydroxymethyldihydropteridine diphosphokinase [Candidatus Thiodiazotropha sp. (ex Cardiolucina cf. quadrata)]MCU7857535.1 2-amino-4-hydroxy-6-hydroxymethyldihydropteridine diphosphokinase [Candidatus Thiodiazo
MSSVDAVTAYIGLGSNLEDPRQQVQTALQELLVLSSSYLLNRSSLYKSRPVGPQHQPDYINAVATILTTLDPYQLLDHLQALEQVHGRVRDGERWGPRTLDLDLLLYGDSMINTPRLQIPHPEMANRAFVLLPLSEIAPMEMEIPGKGVLKSLLEDLAEGGIERLE